MAGVPLEGVELTQPAAAGGHSLLHVLLHADKLILLCAGHHIISTRSETAWSRLDSPETMPGHKCHGSFCMYWGKNYAGLQGASKPATKGQIMGPGLQGELDLADQHAAVLLPACLSTPPAHLGCSLQSAQNLAWLSCNVILSSNHSHGTMPSPHCLSSGLGAQWAHID